ncbi:hypothetical protein [Mesorhizobium sp. M6A.T.Ce.TU.002.03.1.1]|uniref:hypothetical protein n=1 Tax=Mesorhizobium sp. M6A.T.Ce.TU.002.03.1.1 TaxID=2496782 RepID=UPI0032AFFB44
MFWRQAHRFHYDRGLGDGIATQTSYIRRVSPPRGNERMSQSRLSTIFTSALLATAILPGASPAALAQVLNPADRNALVRQNELQVLENRLRRQQYQQQQQQFRAQDREVAPQRPDVQQMQPTCQLRRSGSRFISTCR